MMDDRQTDELKSQIEQTRCSLADKLETLEERIVEPATAAVTDTVTKVKEAVENTAEAVQSTMSKVTQTFDLAMHVRNHPWKMIGAGVAAGFLLGQLSRTGPKPSAASSPIAALPPNPEAARINGQPKEAAPQQRSDSTKSSEGWTKLTTEIQGAVIHSLAPILQGLIGAALVELFRQPQARPISTAEEPTSTAHRHQEEIKHDWTDGEVIKEPDWGGRFRSTPK